MDAQTCKTMFSSARNNWETPEKLFNPLNRVFIFDLDVCAASETAKCNAFFGEGALTEDWAPHCCFCNPPYGRGVILPWVEKAREEVKRGATVVLLLPARPDQPWFQRYCTEGTIYFLRRRLRFRHPDKPAATGAPFPSMLWVMRPNGVTPTLHRAIMDMGIEMACIGAPSC